MDGFMRCVLLSLCAALLAVTAQAQGNFPGTRKPSLTSPQHSISAQLHTC